MRRFLLEFIRRGLTACGFGPLVLLVFYLISQHELGIQTLPINEVCLEIASLSALAFIAGGMTAVYQIEQVPLMIAVSIHGIVLYISYLGTYLLNGWLTLGTTPIVVFSAIFVSSYLTIWAIIYSITKKRTAKLNDILKEKRRIKEAASH